MKTKLAIGFGIVCLLLPQILLFVSAKNKDGKSDIRYAQSENGYIEVMVYGLNSSYVLSGAHYLLCARQGDYLDNGVYRISWNGKLLTATYRDDSIAGLAMVLGETAEMKLHNPDNIVINLTFTVSECSGKYSAMFDHIDTMGYSYRW